MTLDLFNQPKVHAKGYTPSEQDTRRIARSASAMNAKVLALFLDNPNTGYIAEASVKLQPHQVVSCSAIAARHSTCGGAAFEGCHRQARHVRTRISRTG